MRAFVQCFRSDHACLLQLAGQVDALAVLVEPHEDGHVSRRAAADAQFHGIDQAVQAVCRLQLPADQSVAQPGPGGLTLQVQAQAVRLGEALGGRDHQRGAVGQCHEAHVQAVHFRGVATGHPVQRITGSFFHRACFIKGPSRKKASSDPLPMQVSKRRRCPCTAPPLE